MKKILIGLFKISDVLFFPITILAAIWSRLISSAGWHNSVLSERIFMTFGVLPIRDQYYQPLINPKRHLKFSLRKDRILPGLDLNKEYQLQLLGSFNYNEELLKIPIYSNRLVAAFYYNNGSFQSGDAEFLYNIIRFFKPKRIVEIGSGHSTLMAIKAIDKNKEDDFQYYVEHICIEPFEQPWLEGTSATIIRKKVEDVDRSLFQSLASNDILFIDSSHVIRPQGDVLFEYLEILPTLNSGVLVHIHDIFTPRDYLDNWIYKEHKLWNEQYLLEAFLSLNNSYEVIGALNFLAHNNRENLGRKCPIFELQKTREPGSFWIRRK
ncbi:MAG: class I SAM-dependent methyltransferase [Bacteroidota bacterium]